MRFDIKKMKYQGIFLAVLTGVLAIILVVSSVTNNIKDTPPPVVETPADSDNVGQPEDNLNVETNDFTSSGGSGSSGSSGGSSSSGHTHNWIRGGTVEPTCEEAGYDRSTCHCGEEKKSNEKAALGHEWGEWSLVPAEEEGEEAYMIRVCQRCEKEEKKTEQDTTPPAGGDGTTPDGEQGGEDETNPDDGDGSGDGNGDGTGNENGDGLGDGSGSDDDSGDGQ